MVAEEVLDRILQLAGNTGATDEHRVANYIAVRYPGLYGWVAEAFAQNKSLTSVEIRPSPLSGARKVLRVVLTLRHRTTDFVEKVAADVDATGGYPFLVNGLAGYYEH